MGLLRVDLDGDGGIWSAYQNIKHIYNGPDWSKDIISPQTNFFNDVKNGKLRALSWVTPTCANSDHAGCGGKTGPAWVASLVNAIGQSQYWNSTAIFIFWDDYGGWYDPKAPKKVDYDGLGLRLPMLIVSAYAKKGKIDHTPFEHGSILRFVEDTFGLPALLRRATRARPPRLVLSTSRSLRGSFKKYLRNTTSTGSCINLRTIALPTASKERRQCPFQPCCACWRSRSSRASSARAAVGPAPPARACRFSPSRCPNRIAMRPAVRSSTSSSSFRRTDSFNNLFYGFPGAQTVSYGYDMHGKKIELEPISLDTAWDIDHSFDGFFAACDGTGSYPGTGCRMNGFNNEVSLRCGHRADPKCPHPIPAYSYVPHGETRPYFYMGQQYVLADEMFASNFDASSFISHQYIIAGKADRRSNYPDGAGGAASARAAISSRSITKQRGVRPGDSRSAGIDKTIGDEMDKAGLSWAYYATLWYGDGGIWSAYQNIKHIYYGPDWHKDVISPQTEFFSDVTAGKLRASVGLRRLGKTPITQERSNKTGPSWVASLVNAIGESKYWNSTAIFIFWDDYGGWYDPQAAAARRLRRARAAPSDADRLAICEARERSITRRYEHGSILNFVEDQFGLPRLAASDRRATSPHRCVRLCSSAPQVYRGAVRTRYLLVRTRAAARPSHPRRGVD